MKKVLFILALVVVVVAVLTFTGYFANHPAVAAGLIVAGVFVVLLVGIVAGSVYSAWLMRKGAQIVTEDRKATAAVGSTYAGFAREMVRHLGHTGGSTPALPLPSQEQGYWLPALTEFEQHADVDGWDVLEDDEGR